MPVNTADEQMKQKYMDMVRRSAVNSSLEQLNKFGLQMFLFSRYGKMYIMQRIWTVSLLQKWKKILCIYRASYAKIM